MELFGKNCRACIFDFDGVIVDTERYHFAAWNHGGALFGGKLTWEEYLPLKSTSRDNIMDSIQRKAGVSLTDAQRQQLMARREAYFDDAIRRLSQSDIIPGAEGFLERLTAQGIPLAMASSSSASTQIARQFGLDRYFAVMLDGNCALPRKPRPDMFLEAARLLGAEPVDCIVFEDSLAGIRAAQNAGMTAVAIGGIRDSYAIVHMDDFTDIARYMA